MKAWYRSRTLWFNAFCAALAALEGVTGVLEPYIGHSFYAALCVALPIGNAMLRIITTQGVGK